MPEGGAGESPSVDGDFNRRLLAMVDEAKTPREASPMDPPGRRAGHQDGSLPTRNCEDGRENAPRHSPKHSACVVQLSWSSYAPAAQRCGVPARAPRPQLNAAVTATTSSSAAAAGGFASIGRRRGAHDGGRGARARRGGTDGAPLLRSTCRRTRTMTIRSSKSATLLRRDGDGGPALYRSYARVTIGPWIEKGFYYDFDRPEQFQDKDLRRIKKEMDRDH